MQWCDQNKPVSPLIFQSIVSQRGLHSRHCFRDRTKMLCDGFRAPSG